MTVSEFVQETRGVRLNTALGSGAFGLHTMTMSEGVSNLFHMEVEALSNTADVPFDDLLGSNVTVALDTMTEEPRFFNAFVSHVRFIGAIGRNYGIRLTCVPWFWFLTLSRNCRIFHDKDVQEVVTEVLDQHGLGDYQFRLDRSYPKYEYCVQYNETDFDFICRQLEREGITYYFEHENGSHRLVFVDAMSRHDAYQGYETYRYEPSGHVSALQEEAVHGWMPERQLLSTRVALRDYYFETPTADLNADSFVSRGHDVNQMEVYEYPGLYHQRTDGTQYAKTRVEEQQAGYALIRAGATLRGVVSGHRFRLEDHPVDAFNGEYLVLSVEHRLSSGVFETGDAASEGYECSFTAMPTSENFRPPRRTPWPRIPGPQTAMVVGKEGEEIDPDKYGRVKVRFHWSSGEPSCWIRVTQAWTGPNWGALNIPRIGEEVIVEFEDGNPDRPIITGRVYNGKAMPPYDPPEKREVTTFKTNSSKGGGGFNELRFDDKKGEENIFIHAQKDMDIRVRNTTRKNVGNESHVSVGKSHTAAIGEDSYLTVGKSHVEAVGEEWHSTVGLDAFQSVGMSYHLNAGMDSLLTAGMTTVVNSGMDIHLKAGLNVVIEGGMNVTLKAASGDFITVGPAGVFIKGTMVMINSGGAPSPGPGTKASKATDPDKAKKAKTSKAGKVGEKPPSWARTVSATELDSNPATQPLRSGQQSGAPFVDRSGGGQVGDVMGGGLGNDLGPPAGDELGGGGSLGGGGGAAPGGGAGGGGGGGASGGGTGGGAGGGGSGGGGSGGGGAGGGGAGGGGAGGGLP